MPSKITVNWDLYAKQIKLLRDSLAIDTDLGDCVDKVEQLGKYNRAYRESAMLTEDLRKLHMTIGGVRAV